MTAVVSPAGATVSYQWQQASGGEYTPIDGATGNTFVLTSDQVGKTVRCECTGMGEYTGAASSDAIGPVTGAQERQAIVGAAVVGSDKVSSEAGAARRRSKKAGG